MAGGSVFNKRHVEANVKSDLAGVVEQLNLPPAIENFIKKNKKLIQFGFIFLICLVVGWSFYDAYRDKKIEKAANALAIAEKKNGTEKIQALEKISNDYSGTTSATWASLGAANALIREGKTEEALTRYIAVRKSLSESSPLYYLVSASIAQAEEKRGNFQNAAHEYEQLKSIPGYESVGYLGLAGVYEEEGENSLALQVYEEYLGTFKDGANTIQKNLVQEKIARLKSLL